MRYRYQSKPAVRTITVKYAGKCACCGAVIKAGETADYYPLKKQIAHVGGLDGNSPKCTANIKSEHRAVELGLTPRSYDRDFVDLDRMYEDQCADICGR